MARKFKIGDAVDLKICLENEQKSIGTVVGYDGQMTVVSWNHPYFTTVPHFARSLMLIITPDMIFKEMLTK